MTKRTRPQPEHETAEPLAPQRDRFSIPEDVTYLNSANLAPQLDVVRKAGELALDRMAVPWERTNVDWFTPAEALRAVAAALMGADADGIALVPAVSYGVALAAANIPMQRGQNVVVLHEQFPSNVYAWREKAHAVGAELRTVRRDAADDWTAAVVDGIDASTAVVAVPNFHWVDGARVDLVTVGRRARAVGAALVVDVSQSFGACPTDAADIRPDFLMSVGYKWQLGPYGLAYLYVAPRWREVGRPLESSWLTRAGAEDFAKLVEYEDGLRPGARRFDGGEYPQFAVMPMAQAALEQLNEWSIERVAATISRTTATIAEGAASLGCSVLPRSKRAGHILGIRPAGGVPPSLGRRLAAERVYVGVRGDCIRVAPHVHNREADAHKFVSLLRASLEGG